jgi:hypothetical protein
MEKSRLAKLAALTQGVALVSSLSTAACDRSQSGESTQPPMQPAINAPPSPQASTPAATASAPTGTDDTQAAAPSGTVPTRRFPVPNAMPGRRFQGDAGP